MHALGLGFPPRKTVDEETQAQKNEETCTKSQYVEGQHLNIGLSVLKLMLKKKTRPGTPLGVPMMSCHSHISLYSNAVASCLVHGSASEVHTPGCWI